MNVHVDLTAALGVCAIAAIAIVALLVTADGNNAVAVATGAIGAIGGWLTRGIISRQNPDDDA